MNHEFMIIYDGDIFGNITGVSARFVTIPICPDLLDYELIGEADNLRGKVVRAFFWVMRLWPA